MLFNKEWNERLFKIHQANENGVDLSKDEMDVSDIPEEYQRSWQRDLDFFGYAFDEFDRPMYVNLELEDDDFPI